MVSLWLGFYLFHIWNVTPDVWYAAPLFLTFVVSGMIECLNILPIAIALIARWVDK